MSWKTSGLARRHRRMRWIAPPNAVTNCWHVSKKPISKNSHLNCTSGSGRDADLRNDDSKTLSPGQRRGDVFSSCSEKFVDANVNVLNNSDAASFIGHKLSWKNALASHHHGCRMRLSHRRS